MPAPGQQTITIIVEPAEGIQVALERCAAALESIDASLKTFVPDTTPVGMIVQPQGEAMTTVGAKLRLRFKQGLKASRVATPKEPLNEFTITNDPNNPMGYICYATNAAGDVLDVSA